MSPSHLKSCQWVPDPFSPEGDLDKRGAFSFSIPLHRGPRTEGHKQATRRPWGAQKPLLSLGGVPWGGATPSIVAFIHKVALCSSLLGSQSQSSCISSEGHGQAVGRPVGGRAEESYRPQSGSQAWPHQETSVNLLLGPGRDEGLEKGLENFSRNLGESPRAALSSSSLIPHRHYPSRHWDTLALPT